MNAQTFQMVNLSVDDLTKLISNCVKAELQNLNEVIRPNPETSDLLNRAETAKLLKVSFVTLFHWNKDKTLPAQKIGSRVYYQKSVIMNKLNNVA